MDPVNERAGARPRDEEREPALAEIVERFTGKLVTAIVVASGIIGIAIYSRPSPPHYQAVVAPDGRVMRLNTSNGTLIACDGSRCVSVLKSGQHLSREISVGVPKAAPAQLPAPQAPAATPAQPAAAPTPAEQPRR